MTPRTSSFAAASALLAAAVATGAELATRTVDVDVLADGSYRTRSHLELRLATAADADAWSPFAIVLNENRTLESLAGTIAMPDGSTRKLRRSELDSVDAVGEGIVASSFSVRTIRLNDVPAGSVVTLDYATLTRPYYPTGEVDEIRSALAPTTRLAVTVRCAPPGFRFLLSGDATGLTAQATATGVTITGASLPPFLAPGDGPSLRSAQPHLHFGWGSEASWAGVGRWWAALVAAGRPPGGRFDAALADLALERRAPGEVVSAVLAYVRAHVRYVAVEVGIGGWKPADPETTLERGWGDCKALAVLTAALLQRAGVVAVPALAAVSEGALVDPDFPAIESFDHVVVALPGATLGGEAIVDEGGAHAFLDPTDTASGMDRWPTHLMGRRLLVLDGDHSTLVTVASAPLREQRRLLVDLVVAADGSARGKAAVELTGGFAAWWLEVAATRPSADLEVEGRRLVSGFLPAAEITDLRWGRGGADRATVLVQAGVAFAQLLASGSGSAWFQASGPAATPSATVLASRTIPFVRTPQSAETVWALRLPAGRRLAPSDPVAVDNAVAAFTERVTSDGTETRIVRRGELRRRCVAPEEFGLLREVAAAEHRAQRRRCMVERAPEGASGARP